MRISVRSVPWCLLAALIITISVPAGAATVKRVDLDELRDSSESIFWGEVVGRSTRLGTGGKMTWTDYEISVAEHLKGSDPGARSTVSFAGGTVGNLSITVPGVPHLEVGAHYVFFVLPGTRHPSATVGWGQGVFRITRVTVGGATQDLLISYDGEPLQITADGRIERGPLVQVENGSIWDASLRQDPASGRMADPVITSASGVEIPQTRQAAKKATPIMERHWATLDDLRSFVDGRIASSRGGQR